MSRLRTLKPGFFLDDELADCPPLTRLLFAGLWVIADREGRLEDRPKRIKTETLPYDDCDVDAMLDELFDSAVFLKTPYRTPLLGSEAVIKNVTRDDIIK